MAVASGPAGPVLGGPVFTVIFGTAHVQIMNNEQHVWGPSYNLLSTRVYMHFLLTAIASTRTLPRPWQLAVSLIPRHRIISPKRAHQPVN